MKNKLTAMETFVGAGGSYLGLKKAGFKTIYVNEIDKNFTKTLTYNNKKDLEKCIVDVKPIEEVNFQKLRNKLNIKKKKLDLIFGGPVCKGYSLAGVRDPSDIRNTLYRHQIRMIAEFLPKISIIENVPAMRTSLILKSGIEKEKLKEISYIWKQLDIFKGLKAKLTKKGKGFSKVELNNYNLIKSKKKKYEDFVKNNSISVIDDISEMLAKLGYKIYIENLNAAWFGSYTKRVRTFVVAVRKDIKKEFIFPTITNFDYKTKLNGFNIVKDPKPFKTIKEAFKELDYKRINSPKNDLDNAPMNHNEKSVQRFKLIPKGKNIVDVMDKVPKDLKISKFYSRGCTMRLDDNSPSPTLVPGHSNFPVHPYEHRSISVREAAQITGFPSNYKFFGNHTKRCEQVGNAVPIPLAFALANQCKKIL
tara:strand:- start:1262 stop:2521 length:1260 start_codon:yes stop_codon:yes gene_type:complete